MKTAGALVKLIAFGVVTTLVTAVLAAAISNASFVPTKSYKAVFTDVTGLLEGDSVRVAGVRVGEVQDIRVYHRTKALVTFSVADERPLPRSARVAVRWRNLIGQRYLDVTQGVGSDELLDPGDTIPQSHTAPALDLDVLLGGFKPLFRALDPKQVNKLATEIVRTLQGEAGSVQSLLAHTASLTNNLADRDAVIGRVIDNLNAVLGNLSRHDAQLNRLLIQLQRFLSGLSADRKAIGRSLAGIDALASSTAGLLKTARPHIHEDVKQLRKLAGNLDKNKKTIDKTLKRLPDRANKLARTGSYGSWFNFFMCDFDGEIVLPTGKVMTPTFHSAEARCTPR